MSVRILPEIDYLNTWLGRPPRHPGQTHGLNESDSEVIAVGPQRWLASTIDSLQEEIQSGLYADPYTQGWVCAMASLSDLAAVGARPLGMLLSAAFGPSHEARTQRARVAEGFSDALRSLSTYWLGGDTSNSVTTTLTGVALGELDTKPLSRLGLKPGRVLCITRPWGSAAALGMRYLLKNPTTVYEESLFRPQARISEGLWLRTHFPQSACMDTSDGIFSTLATLLTLHPEVSLLLNWSDQQLVPRAREYFESQRLPYWLAWLAEHGDYELVFSISPEDLAQVRAAMPEVQVLAQIIPATPEQPPAQWALGSRRVDAHLFEATALLKSALSDPHAAIKQILKWTEQGSLP